MLSAKHNKQPLNFASYKLRSSLKSKSSNKHQGIKRNYRMDPQQSNPVYRHLRRQRVNRQIFKFILDTEQDQVPQLQNKMRSYSTNFDVFEKNNQSRLSIQMQRFRSQGENILNKVNKIGCELKYNKRRMSILDRYNDIMGKYCEVVPKLKTKNQKELFVAHHQVQKICKQQFLFKDKGILEGIGNIKRFVEPKVNWKVMKKNTRMATTHMPQVQLGKQRVKRSNTFSF